MPDQAGIASELAFIDEWLGKFGKLNASKMSDKQRTDLALLTNKLQSDRWYLTTFREFEWNPAQYNVAGSIDFILNTEYAAQPQRLRTLLKRIASVPQYYAAARASIVNPTREHTQLAIAQSAGVLSVLDDLNKTAGQTCSRPSNTPKPKQLTKQPPNKPCKNPIYRQPCQQTNQAT